MEPQAGGERPSESLPAVLVRTQSGSAEPTGTSRPHHFQGRSCLPGSGADPVSPPPERRDEEPRSLECRSALRPRLMASIDSPDTIAVYEVAS